MQKKNLQAILFSLMILSMLIHLYSCKKKDSFTGINQYVEFVKKHKMEFESVFNDVENYHSKFHKIKLSLDSLERDSQLYKTLKNLQIVDIHIYGEDKPHLIFKHFKSNQDYGVSISKDFTNYIKDTSTNKIMIIKINSNLLLKAEKDW